MSNVIDSIKVSGTVYTLSAQTGGGGSPTVELTQAQYDALVTAGTVSADTYYIITDATAGDLTQYWTSAQTQSAITQATSGKADSSDVITDIMQDWYGGTQQLYIKYKKGGNDISTPFIANGSGTTLTKSGGLVHVNVDNTTIQEKLVSGTNIKTINNESILGSGNIDIQGGGGGIDSGTVQTMIDESISGKTNQSDFTGHTANTNVHLTTTEKTNLDSLATNIAAISGITASKKSNWDTAYSRSVGNAVSYRQNTSDYTSYINKIWVGTQSQYDNLNSWDIDNYTLYIIKDNN